MARDSQRLKARLSSKLGTAVLLTAAMAALIIVPMAIATVIDIREKRANAKDELEKNGLNLSTIARSVLSTPLASGDTATLLEFSAALWTQRDVSYVKIFSSEGALLVGPGEHQTRTGVIEPEVVERVHNLHTIELWQPDGLQVTTPITLGAEIVGVVQFELNAERTGDEISRLTNKRAGETVVLLAIGLVASYILANSFVRPIRVLLKATQRIAGGDLEARVEELPGLEMKGLGHSFNSMAAELQDMVGALQDSRLRIVTGEEQVRRDIASHLHGPVQGRLLALRAQLDGVQKRGALPEAAANSLGSIVEDMGRVIESEIAVLSHRLYPAIVRRGLVPSLQSLCDQFDSTLDLELKAPQELVAAERANSNLFPERIRLAAYRISNEALTNVVKHATTSHVTLSIATLKGDWLTVTVADDGPGFNVEDQAGRLGLAAMRDYAEAVGGMCTILSRPEGGTSVIARLPASQA